MRLFFAGGGPVGEEVMLGSSAPREVGAAPDGPDMARGVAPDPEARLLFRELDGEEDSGLADESTADVRAREGEMPVGSISSLSPRLDIWRRRKRGALELDIENFEIGKAGGKGQVVARKSKGPANTPL